MIDTPEAGPSERPPHPCPRWRVKLDVEGENPAHCSLVGLPSAVLLGGPPIPDHIRQTDFPTAMLGERFRRCNQNPESVLIFSSSEPGRALPRQTILRGRSRGFFPGTGIEQLPSRGRLQ